MALKLVTPPAELVTIGELKQHLRVDDDDQDELIDALGRAATQYVDGWNGILCRALMLQVWDLFLDSFPSGPIQIPLGPLLTVNSVNCVDDLGDEVVVAPDNYEVDTTSPDGWVVPASSFSWPSTMATINAVRVRFTAGYADAAAVPDPIKAAIKMMVGHWFENREAVGPGSLAELPFAVDRLISPYRRPFI